MKRVIELIVTIYHLLYSHDRVDNIGILHANCTKVADQLIISARLIKLLQCFCILGPQNDASWSCSWSVLLLKAVAMARSAARGVADIETAASWALVVNMQMLGFCRLVTYRVALAGRWAVHLYLWLKDEAWSEWHFILLEFWRMWKRCLLLRRYWNNWLAILLVRGSDLLF